MRLRILHQMHTKGIFQGRNDALHNRKSLGGAWQSGAAYEGEGLQCVGVQDYLTREQTTQY